MFMFCLFISCQIDTRSRRAFGAEGILTGTDADLGRVRATGSEAGELKAGSGRIDGDHAALKDGDEGFHAVPHGKNIGPDNRKAAARTDNLSPRDQQIPAGRGEQVDLGLDNLGSGLLGVGGYVSESVYTDFNVNTRGDSELSINLDVSDSITMSGTVDSEGETGIGLFFKRDY
mgnify:CR=1 FL=1